MKEAQSVNKTKNKKAVFLLGKIVFLLHFCFSVSSASPLICLRQCSISLNSSSPHSPQIYNFSRNTVTTRCTTKDTFNNETLIQNKSTLVSHGANNHKSCSHFRPLQRKADWLLLLPQFSLLTCVLSVVQTSYI